MKKSLFLGCLILLGMIVTGCTEENVEETEGDETNVVIDHTSEVKKKEKKSEKEKKQDEKTDEKKKQKMITVNYENGYTLLQPGEIYRNDLYQIQFTNLGEIGAIINIVDGPEQRFFELYKLCPENLEGYNLNLQYFINNDNDKENFSIEENYGIRKIKTYIAEKNVESMRACLMGQNENCVSENKAIPYFVSEEEKMLCEGMISNDPLCEKYNRMVEKYGTIN